SASTSASVDAAPTPQQLLFARALISTFALWPALRLAIAEEWGGSDSQDKADFLLSHLADTHGGDPIVVPDQDDLSYALTAYFNDEYEVRLEDDSAEYVAGRICNLHKLCFGGDQVEAENAVKGLEEATKSLRGTKTKATKQDAGDDAGMASDESDDEGGEDGMDVDGQSAQQQRQPRQRQEPIVDEDGFTMV
ncbi:hypothetical protein IE81DRAFT_282603, partial [Ceraceosorus guamensis]